MSKTATKSSLVIPDCTLSSANLFIAGTGAIGGTLISIIEQLETSLPLYITGVCNTKKMIIDRQSAGNTLTTLQKEGTPTCWETIIEKLQEPRRPPIIFVDVTGSRQVAKMYSHLLSKGIHVVTPSKLANTFNLSYYRQLRKLADKTNSYFKYETTVGAGLPIISTINDLIATGDSIKKISGVVSGTMTYLFNQLENNVPFSTAVKQARKRGYAEPDPRDDLSGEDVARKMLTIAREIGLAVERSELHVESLVPEELKCADQKTFLHRLSKFDAGWDEKIRQAKSQNKTLRYTGTLQNQQITIGVESVPEKSLLGQLSGTDNLIEIYTKRYADQPIVIQGPGAGKEVTAAGVLADILKITETTSHPVEY